MSRGNHGNHARGEQHYRWNSGRMVSSHGYVRIRVGKDHPLADPNGYAYEHLLVWVSAGNVKPCDGEVLHHIDHDPSNNRLENLRLVQRGQHNTQHNLLKPRDRLGRFVSQKR